MKIAIIDDNSTVLKVNQVILKKENFLTNIDEIKTYTTIDNFFEETKNINLFDLIVCDYDLGRNSKNGLEFLKELQEKGFENTTVLLTGNDSEELKEIMELNKNIYYVIKNTNKDNTGTIYQLGNIIKETRENVQC